MKRAVEAWLVGLVAVGAGAGCQIIAGIDDRSLPADAGASDAGQDVTIAIDAPSGNDASGMGAHDGETNVPDADRDTSVAADTGPLTCNAPLADCNGKTSDGCETDVTGDPLHCGSCGHSCLGGQCKLSVCQPFELATGQNNPVALAVDATYLYFTTLGTQSGPQLLNDGAVIAIPIGGGGQNQIATGLTSSHAIAIDDQRVYWASDTFHTIESVKKDGSGRITSVGAADSAANSPVAITIDGLYVYWLRSGGACFPGDCTPNGQVLRAFKDGTGGTEILASNQAFPTSLVVTGTTLLWTNRGTGEGQLGALMKLDLSSSGNTPTVFFPGDCDGVAVASDHAYTIAIDVVQGTSHGALWSIPLSGGASVLLATLGQTRESFGLAADATNVYADTDISGGVIQRTAVGGGTPFPVAFNTEGLSNVGMVLDATSIYWASTASGKVMRLAK